MTRCIIKYKSRLKVDGSRMKKVMYYKKIYNPVASWNYLWLITKLATEFMWHTVHIDYVLDYIQEPVEK